MEATLASGLVVTDRRHHRSHEVHSPNGNEPSTVGPDHLHPGTGVMYPVGYAHAESWDGWPTEWHPPTWGEEFSGYGYGRHNDIWGRVSTAMSCVDLNSRQLASFPTYGMKGSAPFDLPSWSQNPEPSIYASWNEAMHSIVNSMELRGEAILAVTGRYAPETEGVPGRISRFVALNVDTISVEWADGVIEYSMSGLPLDRADILHIKYQSWPGRLRGVSPLEWVGRSMATSSALETYAANLATRGGIPWAVLKSRGNIDKTQAETLQGRWVTSSQRRDGAPAVMGGDLDLVPLTISPRDMALLELREFDERRICAAFGVPAYLVNVTQMGGMTYANASDLRAAHWQSTLRPLAQVIADAMSAWLLPRGSRMEFNPDRYVQPNLGERATAWSTLFNIVDQANGERAISIEEIRSAERLLPQPNLGQAERLTGASV